jgi:hypothetical protein
MMNFVTLIVVILSVAMLWMDTVSDAILSNIMVSGVILSVIYLKVFILSVVMPYAIIINFIKLGIIKQVCLCLVSK